MLDPYLRPLIDRPLRRAGGLLAARGVGADSLTLIGFGFGVAAMAALALRADLLALALILANRLCDGLDGAVARHRGATDFGGYLDIVLDFLIYSGLILAFAIGRPDHALAAAFLIFSFVGTGSAFLAYAVFAAKRGLASDRGGPKSLFYIGGLAEGSETILVLVAICLVPDAFAWIAYGFGAVCWLTTLGRILAARRDFGQPQEPPPPTGR